MDIYERSTFGQLFAKIYPQLYGIVLAAVAFFLVRFFGENFIGGTLGLKILVIPLNLLIVTAVSYLGHRLVKFTAEHEDQTEGPWHFAFMEFPMLAVIVYIFFYLGNII
jgi:hypothetical protein